MGLLDSPMDRARLKEPTFRALRMNYGLFPILQGNTQIERRPSAVPLCQLNEELAGLLLGILCSEQHTSKLSSYQGPNRNDLVCELPLNHSVQLLDTREDCPFDLLVVRSFDAAMEPSQMRHCVQLLKNTRIELLRNRCSLV